MSYLYQILQGVISYLQADWWVLALGAVVAVAFQVYLPQGKIQEFLNRHPTSSAVSGTMLGAFTPLCACGTMAVIISLFVAHIPWAPIMAFLVASPIIGPQSFLFSMGFLGLPYAVALLVSAVILGLTAGFTTTLLEKHTSLFSNQLRSGASHCSSCQAATQEHPTNLWQRIKGKQLLARLWNLGVRKILLYFVLFITLGQLVELLVPQDMIKTLFGDNSWASIPLAATIGLPLYLSGSAALPLLRSFMEQGASLGAILAFSIAGKATGIPVIIGMSVFLRKKIILFYVLWVYLGAIAMGLLFDLILGV